mgnify:CR=1 FL=1
MLLQQTQHGCIHRVACCTRKLLHVAELCEEGDRVRQHVKINEHGRRIGEDHPRAVLLDHEVDLLLGLLGERDALIAEMRADGVRQHEIDQALATQGLSYRKLAVRFEVHWRYIGKIASGERRGQCPVPLTRG